MPTLLITDDHASVLRALEFVLVGSDLRVVLAQSGTAALASLEHETPDAALVDLHMPGMDGLMLRRALKEHATKNGGILLVWIMTAAHTSVAVEQARLAGAEALLKKPFDCGAFREELLRRWTGGPAPSSVAA